MRKLHAALLLLLLSLFTAGARAEPGEPDEHGEGRHARMERRMRRIHDRLLRDGVGLDEAKAKKIDGILDKYAPERKKLHEELGRQKRALHELVRSDSDDEKAYAAALAGLRKAKKAMQALRDKQTAEIEKQLTPRQQARLMIVMKKARHRMQRAMREERHREKWDRDEED